MASEKARYWMAVGVAALFLSNSFLGGRNDWGLRLADRSMVTAQRISSQAMHYAMLAEAIFGHGEARFVQTQSARACVQTRLAVVQTDMAPGEAGLARIQAGKIRVLPNRAAVAYPRQNLIIKLPDIPVIAAEGTI